MDGTFLESSNRQKDELYQFLKDNPNFLLVFVTGRNTELILPVLDDMFIPTPDYIIGDVGATVINGKTQEHIQPLQHNISKRWQEALKDISKIPELKSLDVQDQPQERRKSFYIDEEKVDPQAIIKMLEACNCDVLHSNSIYLDILPKGVNKGATLHALIEQLGIPHENVMVAGDTMNDFSMYDKGYRGVVLNNSEQPLKDAAKGLDNVYYSAKDGTDGIMEALDHFDMLKRVESVEEPVEYGDSDLVMVYHRLPFKEVQEGKKTIRQKHSSPNGIIPTLLGFFSEKQKGSWVAWSLSDTRHPEDFEEHVYVDREKYENLKVCRVPLTEKDVKIFYEVFSKEAFWLLIHSFHEKAVFNHDHWDHFVEINRIFAEKAAQEASKGATVWVHDYNLWLVPGILRGLRPDVKIAFYHHTPFPSADIFNMLPWSREIINSLLQCNYVGFHIPQYVDNFVNVVRSNYKTEINKREYSAPRFKSFGCAIGVERYVTSLTTELNTLRLGAHPVGINCNNVENLVNTETVQGLYDKIREEIGDRKCILSIERTDYTKGPIEKLKAFEKFLEDYPDMRDRVSLIMVCTPAAKGMKIYDEISQDIAYHVGIINGRYGTYSWTPIKYINRMVPFEDVIAYYKAADVAWVTPLRDGLNLVSKEFVMAKHYADIPGALVLSEFAGAAVELHGAFLVNPYDVKDMSETLHRALTATDADKKSRIRRMASIIKTYDVYAWGKDFLNSIKAKKPSLKVVKDDDTPPSKAA